MIYVDTLTKTKPGKDWPYRLACHLTADTDEELHQFAIIELGMKLEWHQTSAWCVHYRLTANKRELAIQRGAKEMTPQRMVQMIREWQAKRRQAATSE